MDEQYSLPPPKLGGEPADLELLRLLEQHPEYSQRQLSNALGMSLGKTHYLLRALLDSGLVKAQNFRTISNKLGYLYVLTPNGLKQRLNLTQSFLARKEREYISLQAQIAALRRELASHSDGLARKQATTENSNP